MLLYKNPGNSIENNTKKVDKLMVQFPVQNPDNYYAKYYGLIVNKENRRILAKIPRHLAALPNSQALYKDKCNSEVADCHNEYATRTKEHIPNDNKNKLPNGFTINIPFKYTTKYKK